MEQPQEYVEREEPAPADRCRAIRYTGDPENVEAINAYITTRYREASPYSSVPPPLAELVHGSKPYLIVQTPNRLAVAVPGDWIVWDDERGCRPWVQDDYQFTEYYRPMRDGG